MTNTTRLGLTYPPVAGSSTADVPTDMQTFLNQLDALAVAYSVGTFAGRPAASAISNKIYWATDYKRAYWSDGTSWYDVQPPVGAIMPFPTVTPPDATWLYCDGAAVLRSTYAALFGLVSTTYGAGNGSTTFNVPDLRGRVPVGVDGGVGRVVTDPHTIAAVGGSERITLAAAESGLPAHNTGNQNTFHTHTVDVGLVPAFSTFVGAPASTVAFGDAGGTTNRTTSTDSTVHSHPVSAAAAASSHENMPPYLTLGWMIKT